MAGLLKIHPVKIVLEVKNLHQRLEVFWQPWISRLFRVKFLRFFEILLDSFDYWISKLFPITDCWLLNIPADWVFLSFQILLRLLSFGFCFRFVIFFCTLWNLLTLLRFLDEFDWILMIEWSFNYVFFFLDALRRFGIFGIFEIRWNFLLFHKSFISVSGASSACSPRLGISSCDAIARASAPPQRWSVSNSNCWTGKCSSWTGPAGFFPIWLHHIWHLSQAMKSAGLTDAFDPDAWLDEPIRSNNNGNNSKKSGIEIWKRR